MAEMIAIASVLGGAALSATGSMMAGNEKAAAAEFEQQQLEIQSQQFTTAAAQDEAKRRDALTASLENIQALRAGRGVGTGSPTGMAILTTDIGNSETDIYTSRTNYLQKADSARLGAAMAGRKAQTSLLAGYLGAGASLFSGVSKGAAIYSKGSGGGSGGGGE